MLRTLKKMYLYSFKYSNTFILLIVLTGLLLDHNKMLERMICSHRIKVLLYVFYTVITCLGNPVQMTLSKTQPFPLVYFYFLKSDFYKFCIVVNKAVVSFQESFTFPNEIVSESI